MTEAEKASDRRCRLAVAAAAAQMVLDHVDRPDMWLSLEARRDLKRLAEERVDG